MKMLKRIVLALSPLWDLLLAPFVLAASVILKLVRSFGVGRLPVSRSVFWRLGVLPVTDHYYEPFFRKSDLRKPLGEDRHLPGLDLNIPGQLALLEAFDYGQELLALPRADRGRLEFFYDNLAFLSGDAEILYSMIRHFRPARIVEIGSGYSTLMAIKAIDANREDDDTYACEVTSVEPFEHPWLDQLPVRTVRERAEWTDPALYRDLKANDILFIDSSHVTRPQGDIVFEYLEILPSLERGVLVHLHDIFTPRDYPEDWIMKEMRLWNEQYLLEAFLVMNEGFEVIAALNYLKHHHPEALSRTCPVLAEELADREPGSFWIRRVK